MHVRTEPEINVEFHLQGKFAILNDFLWIEVRLRPTMREIFIYRYNEGGGAFERVLNCMISSQQ